jgi:hypothetical protein
MEARPGRACPPLLPVPWRATPAARAGRAVGKGFGVGQPEVLRVDGHGFGQMAETEVLQDGQGFDEFIKPFGHPQGIGNGGTGPTRSTSGRCIGNGCPGQLARHRQGWHGAKPFGHLQGIGKGDKRRASRPLVANPKYFGSMGTGPTASATVAQGFDEFIKPYPTRQHPQGIGNGPQTHSEAGLMISSNPLAVTTGCITCRPCPWAAGRIAQPRPAWRRPRQSGHPA